MVALDATVYPNEAYVLVETDWAGVVFRDTFTRISATDWTPADTGQAYTIAAGVAANYSINGTQGVITAAAAGSSRLIIADVDMLNVDFSGIFVNTLPVAGAGNLEVAFKVRYQDSSNFADARLFLSPGGVVSCNLRQMVAGVETLTGFPAVSGVSDVGTFGWRLQANGTNLRFKVWNAAGVEPTSWNLSMTTTWLTAGDVGVGFFVGGGLTSVPLSIEFDNLLAFDPSLPDVDCATVTRRNTVTGEIVTLRPYVSYDADGNMLLECGQGLWWDTEPPLNVPLEYCAVPCDVSVALNENPSFEDSTAGWTATGGVLTQDCTVAKEGVCSGLLTPTGTALNPSVSQSVFILPVSGTPVTVSTWAQSPQGWNTVMLRALFTYTDLTSDTVESDWVTLDDGEWRFLSVEFTPPKPVSAVTISFLAAGIPPNTTLFRVDEFKLTQPQASAATACETVTVASESVWLKNPLHPCLDVEVGLCSPMLEDCEASDRVSYVGMETDEYEANTVLMMPVNRRYPIAVNRVRRGPANTLRVLAHTCEARDDVIALNEPGDPLLFQAPADYCIDDRYMSVATVSDARISVDQREDFRLISMPHVAVERPVGPADGICGTRFMDLCDIYTSWAAMNIAGLTYTDLLLGEASPNGPGQPEPPAAARTWDDVEVGFIDWDEVLDGGARDWDELRDGL